MAAPRKVLKKQEPVTAPVVVPATLTDIATVPNMANFTSYIPRKFNGIVDLDIYQKALDNCWNVKLEGPTGSGKTSSVLAFAAREKMRFGSVSSSIGLEPSQLFGKYIPAEKAGTPEGLADVVNNTSGMTDKEWMQLILGLMGNSGKQFVWQDGMVTDLVRKGGVLLLNEVNFIPERIGTVLFSLLDKRREIQLVDHMGEVIVAHPDLLIVADMNPAYEGTRPLNKAFANRFAIQLEFIYDEAVEKKLIPYSKLRTMFGQFRAQFDRGIFETPISTNMGVEFVRIAEEMGVDFAFTNFVGHFAPEERKPADVVCRTHRNEIVNELNPPPPVEEVIPTEGLVDENGDPIEGEYGEDWVHENDDINEVRRRLGKPPIVVDDDE